MEIKYCDNCGSRITAANPECMVGDKSHCEQCAPRSTVLETAPAAPTRPRRNTPGQTTTRRAGAPTAAHATGRARGGPPDTGPAKSNLPLVLLGAGAVVFLIGLFVVLLGGKGTPPATAQTSSESTASSGTTTASTKPPTGEPENPWATPKTEDPKTETTASAPANTATDTAAPTFVPRTASDDEAKKLFAPIKKDYDRALATDDLKALRKVVSDLGTVTRDYPNTPTYDKAMELIGHANEARSAIQLRQMQKDFKSATSKNGWTEETQDLMIEIERFCKDRTRKDTKAAQMAMDQLKQFKESQADRIFSKIKSKLEGEGLTDARLDAMDEAGYLFRNFRGTPASNEANKLLEKFHKEMAKDPARASWTYFHKDLLFAPNARDLRGNIGKLNAFVDSGMAEDPELAKLLPRGLKMLARELTPKNREKKHWRADAGKFYQQFIAIDGTDLGKGKVGDQACASMSSAAGKTHVRLLCPLFIPEEDAELKFKYSAPGLKSLTLKIFSNSHKKTFDHPIKKLSKDSLAEASVDLSQVSDGEFSLRNAGLGLMVIEGEKADPSAADAVLHFNWVELNTGRK